ncbi:hypothetical protein FOZ63_004979 [Perkinsus olseni]|uniref:Uncharacterized protein n=1 Tax=Perkinsus olseni TaxID=32597 RepID=A0A7J6PQW6_PEROL|nr:hypothetical protein FOZ63_004979 [Perkinsus olseni]
MNMGYSQRVRISTVRRTQYAMPALEALRLLCASSRSRGMSWLLASTLSICLSRVLAGYCGDAVCETPEFAESCPTDCGEVVRNPRLFGQPPHPPYFWTIDPSHAVVTYLNHSDNGADQKPLAVHVPEGAALTQGLALIPGHQYVLKMSTDASPEDKGCWRGFVYTPDEVLTDTAGSGEFVAPEGSSGGGVFVGARVGASCQTTVGLSSLSVVSLPNTANFGFHYPAVYETFLGEPIRGVPPAQCRLMCLSEPSCCAWQTFRSALAPRRRVAVDATCWAEGRPKMLLRGNKDGGSPTLPRHGDTRALPVELVRHEAEQVRWCRAIGSLQPWGWRYGR